MSFWIKQIKIWSIHNNIGPVVYNFEPNKINVITGDSTTGKTSILAIIDYCLGAEKNNIPDGISEYSSYFGITLVIQDEVFSITRQSPLNNIVINELFITDNDLMLSPIAGNSMKLDKFLTFFNDKLNINKELLVKISREQKGGKMRASFRSFLIFNSLTENIIGDKFDYLDYKFYEDNLSNVIKTIFKYSIVEKSSQYATIENNLEDRAKSERRKEKADYEKERTISKIKDLAIELHNAKIIKEELNVSEIYRSLNYIDDIVSFDKLELVKDDSIDNLNQLKEEKKDILINLRIHENYKNEVEKYNSSLDVNIENLTPIVYLKEKLLNNYIKSPETYLFLNDLEESLEKIKRTKKSLIDIDDFSAEKIILEEKLKSVNRKIDLIKNELESIVDLKNIYIKGQIKEQVENLKENNKYYKKQAILENESNLHLISKESIKDSHYITQDNIEANKNKLLVFNQLFEHNLVRLCLEIQEIIKKIPSLSNYHRHTVTFNLERMIISLIEPKNEFSFPISNIGSKSNYMYLHLSFFLGLHNFLNSFEESLINRFMFIDQPSIPYFSDASNSKDKNKLLEAFSLFDMFIKYTIEKNNKDFQIILVEHASKELWEKNKLTSFHLVKEFIDGTGLLPKSFFS